MTKRHLKRLAAPGNWRIERKTHKWIVRPRPSGHKLQECLPLLHVLRDILGHAENYREANGIIKEGRVKVDGRVVRDPKRGVGIMDLLEIPATKERYIVITDKDGRLTLEGIKANETKDKLLKVVGKTMLKGGILQLNLHDGRNILVDRTDKNGYGVNDTIVLRLKDNTIKQHLRYEEKALVIITKGSHKGEVAKIKEIKKIRSPMSNVVTLEKKGKEFRTVEEYLFVIGKEKPLLSVLK